MSARLRIALFAVASVALASSAGCRRSGEAHPEADASTSTAPVDPPLRAKPSPEPPARPGMAWIPPGTFRAGTPVDHAPRVAAEEMPGTPVTMRGFYIDALPFPNEPGAIPTSNVTRDEAQAMCESRGKRLCTELEWERACKGPDGATYGYGDGYRAAACGTGVSAEEAARRPTGDHAQCKNAFGVADMHGGVWEWTSSTWGRGTTERHLGVLRGGNSPAGELVGRCANAIGRPVGKKSPTMGFRCCAGERNDAEVDLTPRGTPSFDPIHGAKELEEKWHDAIAPSFGPASEHVDRAWRWAPVPNEDLVVLLGCTHPLSHAPEACSLVVGRMVEGKAIAVATTDITGSRAMPDVVRVTDARHLRLRGLDALGTFGRDVTYVYGRVEIDEPHRP